MRPRQVIITSLLLSSIMIAANGNSNFLGKIYYGWNYDLPAKDNNEMTIITGINHKLGKGVYLAPNIHLLQYADGDFEGTIFYLNFEIKY